MQLVSVYQVCYKNSTLYAPRGKLDVSAPSRGGGGVVASEALPALGESPLGALSAPWKGHLGSVFLGCSGPKRVGDGDGGADLWGLDPGTKC